MAQITAGSLKRSLAGIPDDAQIVVHVEDQSEDWIVSSTTYSPVHEPVPGTRGLISAPVFRLNIS